MTKAEKKSGSRLRLTEVRRRAALGALLAAALAFFGSCAEQRPPQKSAHAVPPPAKPAQPSPADLLASRMDELSVRAEDPSLTDDQAQDLLDQMDAAVEAYLSSPAAVKNDPKVAGSLERLCDASLQLELDANAVPESAEAPTEPPTEQLLHVTTFLSPEELKTTYDAVKTSLAQVNLGFEVETNDAVLAYVNAFQTKLHDWFARALARGQQHVSKMQQIFRDEGVPPSLVYLAIVESAFNSDAVSRAKAVGMWQFIAGTAQRYGLTVDFWEDQRRDPEKAGRAAAQYLKDLHGMFGDWQLALAAYNCGEGKIQKFKNHSPAGDFWKARNSRFLRRETREYVPAILAAILIANDPKAYGFEAPAGDPPSDTAAVTISEATDLRVLAKCAQVPVETLQSLNPSLRRLMTPPRPFELKIPASSLQDFQARLDAVPPEEKIAVAMHTVARGESLATIARAYKTSPEAIRLANRMPSRRVAVGQALVVPLGAAASDPSLYGEDGRWKGRGTKVYKVRSGDSLYSISRRTGVPVADLRSLNHLSGDSLRPGQRLVLSEEAPPAKGRAAGKSQAPRSAGGRVHHVQQGDTLWDLARRYGTSVDRICRANRISPGHRLQLGDTLVIP